MGCQYKSEIIHKALEKRFFEIIPASVVSNKLSRLFLKNND